ncbi:hypothetical protein M408DRAFT_193255 [Serendipita vermifera MAFF 305830]|uniref:Uncharacterized protein n=1 Tax=Serendipita vermifera MAFF 305830 TaxID=933852 RepID=A0A0C3B4M2_SERVB|nr:hypothetical protein M408DRAFT_193255 [Serendipita vermifera MAFF 305830]
MRSLRRSSQPLSTWHHNPNQPAGGIAILGQRRAWFDRRREAFPTTTLGLKNHLRAALNRHARRLDDVMKRDHTHLRPATRLSAPIHHSLRKQGTFGILRSRFAIWICGESFDHYRLLLYYDITLLVQQRKQNTYT